MSSIFQSVVGFFSVFKTYAPTYGGGYASSSTVTYLQIGKILVLFPFITGTVTGTPGAITFTLPSGKTAAQPHGDTLWVDNGVPSAPVAGSLLIPLNSGTISVTTGNGASFVAGSAAVNGVIIVRTN